MTHQADIAEQIRILKFRQTSFIQQAHVITLALLKAAEKDERAAAVIADALREVAK